MAMSDFPKIYCPFIRKDFDVNEMEWEKYGRQLQLRRPSVYLVTKEINPDYKWVFEDEDTFVVEKLDGSNVKLMTENGRLTALQNRKNIIDPLQIVKGNSSILEGVFQSIGKGYVKYNGVQVGELIGPKLQGNPMS